MEQPTKRKPSKKETNQFIKYTSLAFQMAITIGIGVWLGIFLDEKFQTKPIFTASCSLFFVVAGIYIGIKDLIHPPK